MSQELAKECSELEAELRALIAENERLAEQNEQLKQTNQQLRRESLERQRIEQALRENLARLSGLIDNLQMGVLVEDERRAILHVNQSFCDLFGLEAPPHVLIGADCGEAAEVAGPLFADPEGFVRDIETRLAAGETVIGEELALADGRIFKRDYVPVTVDETQYGHMWLYRDITARVQAEEALREQNSFRLAIIKYAAEGLCVCHDITAYPYVAFTEWNERMTEITGYTMNEINEQGWYQTVYPDPEVQARAVARMARMRQGDDLQAEEWEIRRANGEKRTLAISTSVLESADGVKHVLALMEDVTERKRAEEVLRESEERFRELADLLPQVVYETNAVGILTYANRRAFDLFGYTRQDFEQGLNTLQMLVPEERDRAAESIQEILMGQEPGDDREYRALRKDGATFPIAIYSAPIIRQGRAVGLRGLIVDITQQKQAEAALRESEAKYRTLVEQSLQGVVIAQDNPVRLRFANRPMQAITGYSPEELVRFGLQQLAGLIHPEDRDVFFRNFRDRLAGKKISPRHEYRVIHRKGDVRWVDIYSSRIEYEGAPATLTAFLDITERKQAELALQESEERYRTLFEQANDAIFLNNLEDEIIDVNLRACALLGYTRQELAAMKVPDLQAPEVRRQVGRAIRQELEHFGGVPFETVDIHRDGSRIPVEVCTARLTGQAEGLVLSIVRDITERKRAEERHARLITAVEQTAESVVITDTAGDILYVNPAFERITGYRRAEALGQNPRLLKSGQHNTAFYRELWATISAGRVWRGRLINKKKDGSLYTEEATISPVRDEQGTIVNYVAVKRDVTRELQLEEQLLQSQKMEAVGQLAGGIAHDFNNLLTAINGFAELMQSKLQPDDPLWEMTERILGSGRRAADLVGQLLAFSRQQVIQPQVLDLNSMVIDLKKMLGRLIGEDIHLETNLAADLWPVKADPTQIGQVIINLAVNARDAMPLGGGLTIETANAVLDEADAADHLEMPPGEYVRLVVSDTGVGMSRAVQARIFEPFFTTKGVGQGTGLGLSTVYGIVEQSGGEIQLYSEEGQGTTFRIYLPRTAETTQPQHPPETGPARLGGSETILLVEDDEEVRGLARRVLHSQGYHLLEARTGEEALRLAASHAGPIHLLLTDVVMPGIGGKALAEVLAQTRAELKVLFMSGYTDNAIARHGVLAPDVRLLPKPFSPGELARQVRVVLDG